MTSSEEIDSEDVSSNFFADEELEILVLVKDLPDPNKFLTKVSVVFIVYFSFCCAVNLFLILDMRRAKHWSRTFRLDITFWYILGASFFIKLLFTYFGNKIRNFSKFAFLIDCILTFFFMLGLYFWLDERLRQYYLYEGYYVIMIGFTLLSNSIFFFISTLVKRRSRRYSILYGIVLTTLSTFISLFFISKLYADTNITIGKYVVTFVAITIFNLYICTNASLVMKLKKEKYYDHEYVYCFFCFFGNITSYFWIDLVKDSKYWKGYKRREKLAKKKRKEARKSRKEAKAMENVNEIVENDIELAEKKNKIKVEEKKAEPVVVVSDDQDLPSGSQI